jgi:hypothetical protein
MLLPGDPFMGVRGVASRFRFRGGATASSISNRGADDRVLRRAAEVARTTLEVSWDILDVRMLRKASCLWAVGSRRSTELPLSSLSSFLASDQTTHYAV